MIFLRMSLHIGDYLKETMHLDTEQHGAYVLLILHYWANGCLPDDDVQLAKIARMSLTRWRKTRPIIQAFFYDGWKNKRIDEDIIATTERSEKFARAGRASGQARAAKKNEHRLNDVGNETAQTFEQPGAGNQEVGEGGSARAHARGPEPSPKAFELAAAYRRAAGVDPDDPQWLGLPYTAELWITRGYDAAAVLACGSELAARYGPKPMNYHAKAIENQMNSVKEGGVSNAHNRYGGHARDSKNGTGGGFASAALLHARAASET